MRKDKRGRTKLPTGEKRVSMRFFPKEKNVIKWGGKKKLRAYLVDLVDNYSPTYETHGG